MSDALTALTYPFAAGLLPMPAPGRGVFLRAEPGLGSEWTPLLVCQQTFKPAFDALTARGFQVTIEASGTFDLALVLVSKHKAETLANIASAWSLLRPGGTLVCAGGNDVGAASILREVKAAVGDLATASKHHCKVFWATRTADSPPAMAQWHQAGRLQRVAATGCQSRPGIYNWDKVDRGSALLAAHLPADMAGRVADLGAGWGYLGLEVLKARPGVTALDLFEAEKLALDAARANFEGARVPVGFHWCDVAAGVPGGYDWVVTNPPFHAGKATDVDLGRAFIASAAKALVPGGRLVLVANRHLPYEAAIDAVLADRRLLAEDGAFKVITARSGSACRRSRG
ncbi:MAG TPA: class I SAM-dependent methyltransferase [Candidatus Omnitrophota bacterium]|nr:class I SAM-dependent methyltransferase [Candidatus Omnitrophota bacterium]